MSSATTRVPHWIHKTLVPLFLLTLCPPAIFLFWYTCTALSGSFVHLFRLFSEQGFFAILFFICKPVFFGSKTAWQLIGCFAAFQLFLMKVIPGKPFTGPVTPKGHIPIYKANGITCYFITLTTFLLATEYFHLFDAAIIYNHFGEILGALNCFSLLFCLFLYFKGIFAPSSSDHGKSGHFLFDYYWGTELYPRIFGFDVKMFTNCRFGMMSWSLILLSCLFT